ncbi:flagellar export protein FliJ [Azonexus sp. IMCC34839]|uniref:flagellar export protein FliJ n=1 Tax=Azonexus sp. IMCC34839 TaxID=3133695 RepID=UPI00399A14E2
MAQTFSLQPLLELMQSRTDEATRKLGQLLAAEQNQRSRLQMLEQYREEYAQRMSEAVRNGLTPTALLNFQSFIFRIDDAIAQQRVVVANSEKNTRQGQQQWQEQNKQLKAIDTLSQRHDLRERYRENRSDQKLQDEFAARRFRTEEDDGS